MKNILLASYGYKRGGELYPENTYSLNGKTYKSRYFFLALNNLLDVKIDKIILFLTDESRSAYEEDIKNYVDDDLLSIVDITKGKTVEEIWKLFDGVVSEGSKLDAEEDVRVYLDITNAFRHLPLVLYTSLSYLESMNKVKIDGIYYGALDAKENDVIPVFDLTNLSKILRGSYAVKQFEESANISGIRDFVNDAIYENTKENPERSIIKYEFDEFQNLFSAGLPLEAGIEAKNLVYKINKRFPGSGLETTKQLMERVYDKLDEVSITEKPKKSNILLSIEELNRTLSFIKWELDTRNIANALLLLREWVISRVMLSLGETEKWIDKEKRSKVEFLLGAFSKNYNKFENHVGYEFIKEWRQLTERRNEYAHGGYRLDDVKIKKGYEKATEFYEFCLNNIDNDEFWKIPENLPGNGSVLITPMGASSGLLYSAVSLVNVDKIIVLTSEKYIPKVNEACSKAGLADMSKVHIVTIKDAFCGFNEAKGLCDQILQIADNSEDVSINLTGGTTAMQWAMQVAYEKMIREGIKVKRVAFVDRRPAVEQQSDPYVLGEMLDIDELVEV